MVVYHIMMASDVLQLHDLGEIHSNWREVIAKGVADKKLPVLLSSPNTVHEDSDDCGAIILVSTASFSSDGVVL